jgi:hypothetical protein
MIKPRTILFGVLAMLVLAAVASATASAHELQVSLRKVKLALFSGTELGTKNTMKGTPFGVSSQIECTHRHGHGSALQVSPGVWQLTGSGELSSCTVVKPANCTVKEPIVVSGGGEFEENGGVMEIDAKPEAGQPFTEITLEGASCSLKGKPFKVEGSQKCILPEAKIDKKSHEGKCEASGSSLKVGGKAATFEGSGALGEIESGEYEGGEKFGAGVEFDVI